MTTEIAGLPFWELTFDADGHPDRAKLDTFLDEIPARGLTDLVVFSHGWNSDRAVSTRLYDRFFGVLAGQLDQVPAGRPVSVGLAGVFWPARRWSDEPIPDFAPPAALAVGGGGGAASVEPAAGAPPAETIAAAQPSVDAATLDGLRETFPAGAAALGRMAELLESEPTAAALEEFVERMREFSAAVASGTDDGEDDREGRDDGTAPPAMLADEPEVLFERFVTALRTSGVPVEEPAGAGGEAGLTDRLRGAWKGAKEALRQLTYWQMKNRAGVVGRVGLGPALGQLHQAAGDVRIHLVGHSFGARLVSYALAGLPGGLEPSPVRSVTLLQGAFSHFAFADPLPLNSDRKGALAGMLRRVNGPLTICFSEHDDAVGRFYPLASMAARDDSAAAQGALFRWGGMGFDGAQGVNAKLDSVQPAGPGAVYRFETGKALNVDASEVVRRGGPPSGAHSDIVHPELTWIVLSGGGIVS